MVSIIIPAYNAQAFIGKCLESVLQQTYKDFELLVINDGSKDNTGTICDDFAKRDSRIHVFHQPNQGVSNARNFGLSQSKGEWITFVDADDIIEPHFLESVQDVKAKDVDWIFNSWKKVDCISSTAVENRLEDGLTISGWKQLERQWNKLSAEDICRCPWSKFFRNSIIKEYNLCFDESLNYGEDTVFNYQYLMYIHSILLSAKKDSFYHFNQYSNQKAVIKYKCTPEGIITARNKIFDIYFSMNQHNLKFERLIFFSFTMIEHYYLDKEDDGLRNKFYNNQNQRLLEKRCLKTIRFYDIIMYLAFKHLPHKLIKPLSRLYLKYR